MSLPRINAFNRLARLGREGRVALPTVIEALKDQELGSSKVRVIAARALARIQLDARSLLEEASGGSQGLFARVMRLNPVVDNKPIASTLGEILTDYSRHRGGYNIEPHMWTSSGIRPHRRQIRFEYKDYQQRLFAAEWEYDAETNKLYPSLQVPFSAYSGLWEYDAKADKAYPRDSSKAPAFWVVVRPYGCK